MEVFGLEKESERNHFCWKQSKRWKASIRYLAQKKKRAQQKWPRSKNQM